MKRFLTALFLVAVFALTVVGFAGCGEKGEKGEKGDKGADGKSAYELWLDAGNSGSASDFLNWLKGEKGEKGEKGDDGVNGVAPLLRVNVFDFWEVSYDNGAAYNDLGVKAHLIETDEKYFEFTLIAAGNKYSVKAKDVNDMPKNVVIPSEYNGKPITEIDNDGFKNCTSIETLHIFADVDAINSNAFNGCTSLKTVWIKSVGAIDASAFEGCSALENLYVGNKLSFINNYAFKDCSSLETVELPESVDTVGKNIFENTAVTSIVFKGTKEQWENAESNGTDKWKDGSNITELVCSDQTIAIS